MMKIHFVSPICLEPWDYRALETGIGGSETSHICLAIALAARGYDVTSYSWLPDDCPDTEYSGVHWQHLDDMQLDEPGVWIIYRYIPIAEKFEPREDQKLWLVAQDVDCPGWTEELANKFDKVLCLCKDHYAHIVSSHPEVAKTAAISSNAVQAERFRKIAAENIERDPKRLMWASSPDRGLECLLDIFQRAKEFCDGLSLHVFYGFNNLEVMTKKNLNDPRRQTAERIRQRLDEPGVVWHGRVGQDELYREWLKTGLWCYPTEFTETSCITCMEAQCGGAIPITNPLWALRDNVRYGVFIPGNPYSDMLVRARYTQSIAMMANSPGAQQAIRDKMYKYKDRSHWGSVADQWERWILEHSDCVYPDSTYFSGRFAFQHKHSYGKILNIGCDADSGNLRGRGAINLDYLPKHPYHAGTPGFERKVDVVADARDLPLELYDQFDCAVLGDILEHMSYPDIVKSLKQAKLCIKNGGQVVITWPFDDGIDSYEAATRLGIPMTPKDVEYAPGCPSSHTRIIEVDEMMKAVEEAGMSVVWDRSIEEGIHLGWGIVAK